MDQISKLKVCIALAKENGLQQLTLGNLSFSFQPSFVAGFQAPINYSANVPVTGEKMPADDEMLYYSADPGLQTDKKQ